MSWEAIGAIAESLGAVGVILTLGYLAFQLRQNTQALKLNAEQQAVQENINLTLETATSDLPEIIIRGSSDLTQLNEEEMAKFGFWANGAIRAWQHQHQLFTQGNLSAESWESSENMIKTFFGTPGFRQYWSARNSTFTQSFRTFMNDLETDGVISTTQAVVELTRKDEGETQ